MKCREPDVENDPVFVTAAEEDDDMLKVVVPLVEIVPEFERVTTPFAPNWLAPDVVQVPALVKVVDAAE